MKQGRGREELLGDKVIHATDQHNSVVHTSIVGVVVGVVGVVVVGGRRG